MTTRPFHEAIREILAEQDVSQRELTRRTRKNGWGSLGTTVTLLSGDEPPSPKAIEEMSNALHVRPETFAEYRLMEARNALDPQKVGLKKALKNLGE